MTSLYKQVMELRAFPRAELLANLFYNNPDCDRSWIIVRVNQYFSQMRKRGIYFPPTIEKLMASFNCNEIDAADLFHCFQSGLNHKGQP